MCFGEWKEAKTKVRFIIHRQMFAHTFMKFPLFWRRFFDYQINATSNYLTDLKHARNSFDENPPSNIHFWANKRIQIKVGTKPRLINFRQTLNRLSIDREFERKNNS